jgi:hypothetical protein
MLSTLRAQKLVGLRSNSPAGLEFLTKAGARRLWEMCIWRFHPSKVSYRYGLL